MVSFFYGIVIAFTFIKIPIALNVFDLSALRALEIYHKIRSFMFENQFDTHPLNRLYVL